MIIKKFNSSADLAQAAARRAAEIISGTIASKGSARIIVATGASHLAFLKAVVASSGIDWSRVEMFHLDEYVGLPVTHGASFRKYLIERFIQPTGIKRYHLLDGEGDLDAVCRQTGDAINAGSIHVAFVGIGENGHLAFNDPPADFQTETPYIIVSLDEACRRQQVGEGWFPDLNAVPKQAITISIKQILKAEKILCVTPELRKAKAVKACLEGPINPAAPASILRTHPDVAVFLDPDSSSLLDPKTLAGPANGA
ncbi:MAG TPA: glucosamine-6-phosphate deaminase [Verrucomicrobiae bacterium]|nr:glucosamine-6-phosphate deaminase [Verrucomicrobiae bacterium]